MVVKVKFEAGDVQAPSHSSIISQPLGHISWLVEYLEHGCSWNIGMQVDQIRQSGFRDEFESCRHLMDSKHSEIDSANDWLSGLSSDIAWNQKRPIVWTIWQWQRIKSKFARQRPMADCGTVSGRLHKISYVAVVAWTSRACKFN